MNFARLTEKHADGKGYYMSCSGACRWDDVGSCAGCSELERIVDRLGQYEDTGLKPEEIAGRKDGECL